MLSGKHALVTGGGTGIGLACAQALAAAGATVTITGRREGPLKAAATDAIHPLVMDVTDEASVTEGIATAVGLRGPIRICVPNAGIAEGRAILKTDTDFWRNVLTTNLDGAFWTIRESLRSMTTTEWGRVVAIASIAGLKGLKGAPAYTASKHGLVGLIRGLAADYAAKPYTFNALCPGYVDTDIVTRNAASIAQRTGMDAAAARDLMVDTNAHGRLIAPSEVSAALMWLCGPGSDSVNGQAIQIAGGEI
jgi:NAD(P)-dependent dehydrogenase (short-subunit alcohol dehydrogenase family)